MNRMFKKVDKGLAISTLMWFVCVVVIGGGALLVSSCRQALGNTWQWSDVGAHHRSIVKINGGGSGVYVQHGTLFGVLTAGHCANAREKSVTFSNGSQASGEARRCKNGYDLGFIVVKSDAVRPIKLAAKGAAVGERVEFVSYGGREGRLRHFWSTRTGNADDRFVWYSAPVTSGDSGCAILNTAHELVGIEAVGNQTLTGHGEWPVYRNGGAAPFSALCDFVARVEKTIHGVGRPDCPPDCPNCPRGRSQGGWDFYPPPGSNPVPNPLPLPEAPRELPPRLPIEPPAPLPDLRIIISDPAADDPCQRLRDRVASLEAMVAALTARLDTCEKTPWPPGADGQGAAIDYDEIARRLPPIRVEVRRDGEVLDSQDVYLGGVLPLELVPQGR
jgi:hypothetical protein